MTIKNMTIKNMKIPIKQKIRDFLNKNTVAYLLTKIDRQAREVFLLFKHHINEKIICWPKYMEFQKQISEIRLQRILKISQFMEYKKDLLLELKILNNTKITLKKDLKKATNWKKRGFL